jgi:dihydroorotate dehydrogenase electron transfer subunit
MTCVLPVIGDDGKTRMLRSCIEGPVFAGESVRFADIGTVPPDAVGAPPAAPPAQAPQIVAPTVEEVS